MPFVDLNNLKLDEAPQGLNPMMANLIKQESGGNPNAVSPKGAQGIVQIMPATARDPGYGVTPLQGWDGVNPKSAPVQEQIRFGNDYLNAMQRINGGNTTLAAAAYNAGPGAVQRAGGDISKLPAETQHYVTKVVPASQQVETPQSGSFVDLNSIQLDASQPPAPSAPSSPDFAQRMQSDFEKRKAFALETAKAEKSGNIGTLQRRIENSGTAIGLVGDFAGNVVGSAARYAGDVIPEAIKGPVKNAGVRVLNYASDSAAGDVARDYAGAYQNYAQENPDNARLISSLGNIGGAVAAATPIKGISAASAALDTAGAVGKGAGKVAGKVVAPVANKLATPARARPNSEQLAEMATKAYGKAFANGEVFDARGVADKFVGALDSAKPKKIAGTVETDLSQSLEYFLGKYRNLAGKPLSIDEVDIIDKDLSNLKDQAYSNGKNQLGNGLSKIQNALRASVSDSPSGAMLAEARDLFRRKHQMEDVERIFRNAEGRPNEAAIIQTGYRNLANQARQKGSGYTKEHIAIMDKAAKGGLSIDALKFASSKLIAAVAAATGGPATGGVAYMGNLAAGAGATALQTAKANRLAQSITKGITVPGEPTLVNRVAAKLTKQDLQKAFEAKKGKTP